jgi:predicted enzyme related to lactoylglutathione lyase
MKFGDVAVVVSDVKKAKKWYVEKLGFKLEADEDHWVTVVASDGAAPIHLCETKPREKGNTGIGFVTKDVAKLEKKLRAKGVKFTQPAKKYPWGVVAMFQDPDGNVFWLSEG